MGRDQEEGEDDVMKLVAKKFDELTAPELYEIMRARNEIFVIEQDCVYQDCDDCDYGYHVFYQDEDPLPGSSSAAGPVKAYMRIYEIDEEPAVAMYRRQAIWANNLTAEQLSEAEIIDTHDHVDSVGDRVGTGSTGAGGITVQMGRVLTIKHGEGLGLKLLREGIKVARDKMHADRIFIEAEDYVIGFYEKEGFYRISEVFMKDEIPHVQMELQLLSK